MKYKLFALLLCCLFLPAVAFAEITLEDVVAALEAPFKAGAQVRIHDFQADFLQQSHLASIDRVQRGRGDVSFKFATEKAMFRWNYSEPEEQQIISDGTSMWVYQPENRQVIESDISGVAQSDNPVTFLSHLGDVSRNFQIGWGAPKTDSNDNLILQLQPKKASQLIHSLRLTVSRKAVVDFVEHQRSGKYFPILATSLTDPNGNRTDIEFQSIKQNTGLVTEEFVFLRPQGVELVRPADSYPGF
ncbi:outer membrane lipoprotein carrier protein [Malonomonas rubra DSM 5091]|uniref:Outer membrane lipoprotein carrier protein n=1 Tax=Malonomonas rubra DSM 5091 TaxID=1122189 RepID=A0A1M6JY91_MALRU|nr:outer membrane lipoprotein carrier protein LolA [Malonomonas rubra]SHJ51602.1 outer membrane lipoprotein carrier protein [Malonomonas rubra DSM 5091]